jgi:hypothetical protein
LTDILFGIRFRLLGTEELSWAWESQVFSSLGQVAEALRATGYIADSIATTTVYLAAELHKPVLLEGPAGSGKSHRRSPRFSIWRKH